MQSDYIIDLLKGFTVLMVLSETENIPFQLVDIGFLGQYLQTKAAKMKDIEIEEDTEDRFSNQPASLQSITEGKHTFRTRYIVFFFLFITIITGWGLIFSCRENRIYFAQKYPNCTSSGMTDKEMFQLNKVHFCDDDCYGGPLNTLGCKVEGSLSRLRVM